jgi:hypothetical protein
MDPTIIKTLILIIHSIYLMICVIGVFSNSLTILVFSRKRFQNTIFSTYFRIMSLLAIATLLYRIEYILAIFKVFTFRNKSSFLCKMNTYLVYVIPPMSNWIQILITIDRFVSIAKPTKFVWRKKAKFQVLASMGVIIFDILYYIPIIYFSDIPELYRNQSAPYLNIISICTPVSFYNWLIALHTVDIPFMVIMIFTGLTIQSLFKSRRNSITKSTFTKSKDVKFAITSISLNLLFFLLSFPLSFYLILRNFHLFDDETEYLILGLFGVLFFINNAVLFFINLIVNSIFRKEFSLFLIETKLKLYQCLN